MSKWDDRVEHSAAVLALLAIPVLAVGIGAAMWDFTGTIGQALAVPAPSQTGGPAVMAVAPCPAAPPGDTLNGTAGSQPCFVPGDATRPTAVQAANVTTDASGNWTVTWGRRFNSASPVVNPLPINTGQLPMLCNVAARSATGANGRCWQSTATTLPGTLVTLAGLVVSPFGTSANNAAVMVIAREPTQ